MNSIARYFRFVKPYRLHIFITIVIGIIKFGIPLTFPLILKYIVDDLLGAKLSPDEKINQLMIILGGAFLLFVVIRGPIEYYRQYLAQWIASKVLFDVRKNLFDHLQRLSVRYYQNRKVGEVISRVINDVEQTKNFVVTGMMNIWLDLATLFIAIVIMLFLDPGLTLVSIALFPFYGLSVKFFYKRLRTLTKDRSQALAEMQGHLHEKVQGISVIRAFSLEGYEEKQFEKRNQSFLDRALDHTKWNAKTFAVINTLTDIGPLLVIGYGTYQVIQGNLTVGSMIAFYGYLERIYAPLRRLVNSSTTLTQSVASMDRVFELLDEPYDIKNKPDAAQLADIKGEVRFVDVSFRYDEDQSDVLKNVNLNVSPGETIALVGMSGGGKSSLISLLPRFYDVSEGKIEIDGWDIRDVTIESLREQIGMVLQDNILFSGTISENIRMGNPDCTDEELVEAAKAANAHEFIMELVNGYDTEIGERGVKLSGGQKQRIAIARVFLKNPRILILDEATSALDLESEHLVQLSLERLVKDRTTFIIAHRLSTITHADRIVVIDSGEIAEQGTHQELLQKEGVYARLYNVQDLDTVH